MTGAFKALIQLLRFLLAIRETICMMFFHCVANLEYQNMFKKRRWGQDKGNYETP